MLVLAHRGLHHDVPENTFAAFERAAAAGVDGIETDVRVSSDGELILFHDPRAPDGTPVRRLTRSQLSRLCTYEIPSLPDVLPQWPDLIWNLEIKSRDVVEPVTRLLRAKADPGRIFVSSFIHSAVLHVTSRLDVQGGLLVAHAPLGGSIRSMIPGGAPPTLASVIFDFQVVTQDTIGAAIRDGFDAYAYNTLSETDCDLALRWGLHGVITDDPGHVRA